MDPVFFRGCRGTEVKTVDGGESYFAITRERVNREQQILLDMRKFAENSCKQLIPSVGYVFVEEPPNVIRSPVVENIKCAPKKTVERIASFWKGRDEIFHLIVRDTREEFLNIPTHLMNRKSGDLDILETVDGVGRGRQDTDTKVVPATFNPVVDIGRLMCHMFGFLFEEVGTAVINTKHIKLFHGTLFTV